MIAAWAAGLLLTIVWVFGIVENERAGEGGKVRSADGFPVLSCGCCCEADCSGGFNRSRPGCTGSC